MGFDSVFISVGTHNTFSLSIEGANLKGITSCLDFLQKANIGERDDLSGKKVMIIGGGNTAIDASRTALRLGASKVTVVYRRSRRGDALLCP